MTHPTYLIAIVTYNPVKLPFVSIWVKQGVAISWAPFGYRGYKVLTLDYKGLRI